MRTQPRWYEVIGFVALCLALAVGWAECVHNNWRCAFAECRIETK